jgi:hypothetical protein
MRSAAEARMSEGLKSFALCCDINNFHLYYMYIHVLAENE